MNKPTPSTTSAPLTAPKAKSTNPKLKLISDADDLDDDETVTDGESDEGWFKINTSPIPLNRNSKVKRHFQKLYIIGFYVFA